MTLPVRRLIWLVIACVGALSLLMAQSTIDDNNIIHDSALMPMGAILLLLGLLLAGYDLIKSVMR